LRQGDACELAHLDEQVEETLVIVGAGGRVGALHLLAVALGLHADVLADGQAEDGAAGRQAEAVAAGAGSALLQQSMPHPRHTHSAVLELYSCFSMSLKERHSVGSSSGLSSAGAVDQHAC